MLKDITEEKAMNMKLLIEAQTDGLTHLLNQTTVKITIQSYLESISKSNTFSGALFIVDLDRFKLVNDTKGHLFGNDVLIATANVLKTASIESDIAGRVGGYEFNLLAKGDNEDLAVKRAKGILKEISEIYKEDKNLISCSIGIALVTENNCDYDMLFNMADKTLYEVKITEETDMRSIAEEFSINQTILLDLKKQVWYLSKT